MVRDVKLDAEGMRFKLATSASSLSALDQSGSGWGCVRVMSSLLLSPFMLDDLGRTP